MSSSEVLPAGDARHGPSTQITPAEQAYLQSEGLNSSRETSVTHRRTVPFKHLPVARKDSGKPAGSAPGERIKAGRRPAPRPCSLASTHGEPSAWSALVTSEGFKFY